ncbi:MAG TPA: hypothetical protein VM425_07745 [Myxococcota bacterium]|nr:hypothetical protein [Myxococcota bacterium]
MLDQIKKAAINQAMKLMTNPKVGKILSDPRFMNAIGKGFEMHGQIRDHVEGKLRHLADSLNLVSKEEFSNLDRKINQVKTGLEDLTSKLDSVAKKSAARKKKASAKKPADAV